MCVSVPRSFWLDRASSHDGGVHCPSEELAGWRKALVAGLAQAIRMFRLGHLRARHRSLAALGMTEALVATAHIIAIHVTMLWFRMQRGTYRGDVMRHSRNNIPLTYNGETCVI